MSKREYDAVLYRARREALLILKRDLKRYLPKGWSIALGVGWSVVVFDTNGKSRDLDDMPKRLRRVIETMAYDFETRLGFDNERIGP